MEVTSQTRIFKFDLINWKILGKSIDELTDYCRKLSTAEDLGELSSLSEDSDHDRDGKERPFHHPFELKDRGPIIMNIRVSIITFF